jgi:hypothetical protein
MSFTRWVICASFTGGIIALSLQPSGIANATKTSTFLVTDQSSGSSQDAQRDSRSGKKGMSEAESSGKMQSDKDAQPGGGKIDPSSKIDGQSSREQGGASQGSGQKDPNYGSGRPSAPPGSSNPGMSGVGTGAGSR